MRLVTVLPVLFAACRAAPPAPRGPLPSPAFTVTESVAPGSALAGPGGAAGTGGPTIELRARLIYVEREHPGALAPLESYGVLVVDLRGPRPILAVPELLTGARAAVGDAARAWLEEVEAGAAGRVIELHAGAAELRPGATYTLEARASERVEDPLDWLDEFPDRGPIQRSASFSWTGFSGMGGEGGPQLAVALQDLDPEREAALRAALLEDPGAVSGPPQPAEDEELRCETLFVDLALPTGELAVVTVPSPFGSGRGRTLAAIFERPEEDAEEVAPAALDEVLARAASAHADRTAPLTRSGFQALELEQAVRAFRERGGRPALLLIAAESGSLLVEDMALTADEATLAELAAQALGPGESEGDPLAAGGALPELAWRLESTAWRILCRRALEQDELEPELEAALLRHAGGLGRYPDVVLDLVAASPDRAAFQARLEEEHLYALEDPDPSTRLRAHDWLANRDRAVPAYDPLAPREERRAALEAARAAGRTENGAEEGGAR